MKQQLRRIKRNTRHKRLRAKLFGTAKIPRFCVFRSSFHIYAQLIDDDKKQTVLSVDDRELRQDAKSKEQKTPRQSGQIPYGAGKRDTEQTENKKGKEKSTDRTGKVAVAYKVGKLIAESALKNKIEKVVFDRGGYKYHGRVKALADGAREGGLKF